MAYHEKNLTKNNKKSGRKIIDFFTDSHMFLDIYKTTLCTE